MPCFFGDTKNNYQVGLFTTKNLDVNPEHDLRPTWIIPGKFCRHEIPLPIVYTETVQKLISEWTENTMMVLISSTSSKLDKVLVQMKTVLIDSPLPCEWPIIMVEHLLHRLGMTYSANSVYPFTAKRKKPSVYRNIHSILVIFGYIY